MKKLKCLLMALIICLSFSVTAYAAEDYDNDPNDYSWETEGIEGTPSTERWSYIARTSQGMSIDDNGKATMTASISGYQDITTKVIIYMYLQQYYDGYWHNLTWTKDEFNSYRGAKERYKYNCSRGTYRLKVSYYAYAGDKYENHVAYSARYHYQ